MLGKVPGDAWGNVFVRVLGRLGSGVGKVPGIVFPGRVVPGKVFPGRVVSGVLRMFWPGLPAALALGLGVRNLFINGGGSARRRGWLDSGGLSADSLAAPCVYEANET
jgi:hypothetical protein